jgi:hypothetical protein
VDRGLNRGSIDVQRATGKTHFSQLDNRLSGAETPANPERAAVKPARVQVFSQRPVENREALRCQGIDALSGNQQNRAPANAMKRGTPPPVARDACLGEMALNDRVVGHAPRGSTDLHDHASHFFSSSLTPATLPSVS